MAPNEAASADESVSDIGRTGQQGVKLPLLIPSAFPVAVRQLRGVLKSPEGLKGALDVPQSVRVGIRLSVGVSASDH